MKKAAVFLVAAVFFGLPLFSQQAAFTSRLDTFFKRAEQNGFSGSVLLAMQNRIVYHKGFGWADVENRIRENKNTVFNIGSITKQFTAAAILLLEKDRKLQLSDPLSTYFPNLPEEKRGITIHQLLTHTSGLPSVIGEDKELINSKEFMKRVSEAKPRFAPGSRYAYSNVGYSILGILIEKISGNTYEKFLRDNIFIPAGMENTGYLLPDYKDDVMAIGYKSGLRWGTERDWQTLDDGPGWNLRANGGIFSTALDLYKWYRAIRHTTVLPRIQTAKYLSPHTKEGQNSSTYYSYGWVVEPMDTDTIIWHDGGNMVHNAYMAMDLRNDICVIISSNTDEKSSNNLASRLIQIMRGSFIPVEAEKINAYAGLYKTADGTTISVRFDENNDLVSEIIRKETIRLLAEDISAANPVEEAKKSIQTKALIMDMLEGRHETLAKAYLTTPARGKYWAEFYFGDMLKNYGHAKSVEVLATVRRKNGVLISFAELDFGKRKFYATVAWQGDEVVLFRVEKTILKVFARRAGDEFYSGSNNMTLYLKEADSKLFIRRNDNTELEATKLQKNSP